MGLLGDYEYKGALKKDLSSPVYKKKELGRYLYIYKDDGRWIGTVYVEFSKYIVKQNLKYEIRRITKLLNTPY